MIVSDDGKNHSNVPPIRNYLFYQASVAQALPDQNKFYSLVNKGTNEVLAIHVPNGSNMIDILGYPALMNIGQLDGAGNKRIPQRWKFIKVNTDLSLYFIQQQNANNVFDVTQASKDFGMHILLHPQVSSAANEKFYLIATGEANTFYISSLNSGLVLDGTRSVTELGKENFILQMGFNGSIMQKWVLETVR